MEHQHGEKATRAGRTLRQSQRRCLESGHTSGSRLQHFAETVGLAVVHIVAKVFKGDDVFRADPQRHQREMACLSRAIF